MVSAATDAAAGLEVLRRLAIGGMAEVFLARNPGGGEVVLKVLLPHLSKDPEMVSAFRHEAAIGQRLAHPRIAEVRGSGTHDGSPCLVLSRVDGVTLADLLAGEAPASAMPLGAALAFALDLLEALAHAHGATDEHGAPLELVHRDVSPRNVFVTREGRAVLGDFGIARSALREGRTRTGAVKGTLGYLAPEQVTGSDVDARADVFAVGALVFELVTGSSFIPAGGDLDRLRAAEAPTFRAPSSEGADPRLDRILRRALARFPEERHGSAAALRRDLAALVSDAELEAGRAYLAARVDAAAPASRRSDPSAPSAPTAVQGGPRVDGAIPRRGPGGARIDVERAVAPVEREASTAGSRWRWGLASLAGVAAIALTLRAMDATDRPPRGGLETSTVPLASSPPGAASGSGDGGAAPSVVAPPPPADGAAASAAASAPTAPATSAASSPRVAPSTSGRPPSSAAAALETPLEVEVPAAVPPASSPPPATAPPRETVVRSKLDGVSARLREAKRRGIDVSAAEARAAVALEAFLDRRYDAAERELDAIAASLPP